MTLTELRAGKYNGKVFNLVHNASGKGLGERKLVEFVKRDSSLAFELPHGTLSYASLRGVRFVELADGFQLRDNSKTDRLLAEYVLTS
jgi:hypothetical protein